MTLNTQTDGVLEGPETVVVTLGTPTGQPVGAATVSVVDGEANGNITDTSTLSVAISDAAAVDEGQSLQYTVTLSGGTSSTDLSIPLTYGGSADPVLDLNGQPITVTIKAGETTATVSVLTQGDSVLEGDETVTVTLGNPGGQAAGAAPVTVSDGVASGTVSDTTQLSVSISDAVAVDEGQSLQYTVTLSGTSTTDITVPLTYGGSADPVLDHSGQPITVTIKAGDTTATVSVPTQADSVLEGDETVAITLGNPSGQPANANAVALADGEGTGTITDTSQLTVSVSDAVAVDEGGNLNYLVTLSGTSTTDITIPVTYSGTAADGSDYTQVATVTIKAGESTGTLTLNTQTDGVLEGPETVTVTLGTPTGQPVGAATVSVVDGEANGNITDTSTLSVAISDAAAVDEGQSLQYTVTLSGGTSSTDLSIPLTYGGSADPVLDLNGQPITVTIKAGETTATVSVLTQGDSVLEGDETVTVTLGNPGGQAAGAAPVTVSDGVASGTVSDTTQLSVSISDAVAVDEGQSLQYTVTLSGTSTTDITVPLTYGGSADPVLDHSGQPITVTIKAGDTTATVSVPTQADSVLEGDETVAITLGNPSGQPANAVALADGEGTGTITDTSQLTVSVSDAVAVDEGGNLNYLVTLSGTSTTDITIPVTYRGTAADGSDYTQVATVTIKAGESTGTLTLNTQTDGVLEGPETVTVTLGTPTGQPVGAAAVGVVDGEATGVIADSTQLNLNISSSAPIDEGDILIYTVSLDGSSTTNITIPLIYAGTGQPILDYNNQPFFVIIPAGQSNALIRIATNNDFLLEAPESIIVTLGQATGEPVGAFSIGGAGNSATGIISDITVNQPPIAVDDTVSVIEDQLFSSSINLQENDSDINGTPLKVLSGTFTTEQGGIVVINSDGSYSYNPPLNFDGTDSVTYTVSDGVNNTLGRLILNVVPVNDAPVAENDRFIGVEDVPFTGNLLINDSDIDNTLLNVVDFSIDSDGDGINELYAAGSTVNIAGVGQLVVNANGSFSLIPVTDFTGSVPPVTYTITDGQLFDVASLDITFNPENDSPVATPDTNNGIQGFLIEGNVLDNDTDTESDALFLTVFQVNGVTAQAGTAINLPGIGSLIMNPDGSYIFTPESNFNGDTPQISYTVSDGSKTDIGTLNLSIAPLIVPPSAQKDTVNGKENLPVIGNVLDNDFDPSNTGFVVRSFDVDTNGDGIVESFLADSTVTIRGIGQLTMLANGKFTFVPTHNFNGVVPEISYTAELGDGVNTSSSLEINIESVNDVPIAQPDRLVLTSALGTISGNVLLNDNDLDNDELRVTQFSVEGLPGVFQSGTLVEILGIGTLVIESNGNFQFTPHAGYQGNIPLVTYTISDGTAFSSSTLSFAPIVVIDNGALIMLSNQSGNIATENTEKYAITPFREPASNWSSKEDYHAARLSLYGSLLDYDIYLTGLLPDQTFKEAEKFSFSIPSNIFRHSNPNEILEYSVNQANGLPLPSWLHFDPKKLVFTGLATKDNSVIIMVKAKDRFGKEAYTTFSIKIKSNPNVKGHTPSKPTKLNVQKRAEMSPDVEQNHAIMGKLGFSDQVKTAGRLGRLMESRALLTSLSTLSDSIGNKL